MKLSFLIVVFIIGLSTVLHAQEYVAPVGPVETGKSPGMKAKLISSHGNTKTYVLVFSPGDEVRSGLTEFARKYQVGAAHYTAVGDVVSGKVGFYDYQKKLFKVIPIDTAEVVSFTGNITLYNKEPVAHTHASFSMSDGSVRGGHLLELVVGPTLEVFVIVEPSTINKKLNPVYNATVIDPLPEN